MQNFSLAGWYNIFQNNFLCDCEWRKLAETCKEINKIFQYFLAKDNYPSTRTIHIQYNAALVGKLDSLSIMIMHKLCLSHIKYMLEKLVRLSHRWTIPLIVNKITKNVKHSDSTLCLSFYDIIKVIPKKFLIDLTIETTRSKNEFLPLGEKQSFSPNETIRNFVLINMNEHSGITRLEQELCSVSEQLVSLNVWNIDIDASCINKLINILPNMTCLKKLNISGNNIKDAGMEQLVVPLANMTQLTSLNLEAVQITHDGMLLLSNTLVLLTNLTELNLGWLFLIDLSMLIYPLTKMTKLKSLNLNYNRLGYHGLKTLAPTLMNMTQLNILQIECNHVGVEGATIMANMVKKLINLTRLDIGINEFGNSKLIGDAIAQLTNLTILDQYRILNKYTLE